MAQPGPEAGEVNARIVYWGIPGAGVSASLRRIQAKLRTDHRAELRQVPTRLDPTVTYEVLPIELGVVSGVRTRLQILAVPGGAEQAPTRKQLLNRIDGLVLVIDCQRARIQENLASLQELRAVLKDYGRTLEDVPTVVQYNKSDLGDPGVVEELHRGLGLTDVAAFETVAAEGSGVLQALTTISKRVVRVLRERGAEPRPAALGAAAPPPAPEETPTQVALEAEPALRLASPAADAPSTRPVSSPRALPPVRPQAAPPKDPPVPGSERGAPSGRFATLELMEQAILSEGEQVDEDAAHIAVEAEAMLDSSWHQVAEQMKSAGEARIGSDLRIVSVGTATRAGDRAVRVPLVLGNRDGESVTLALTIALEPVIDGEEA